MGKTEERLDDLEKELQDVQAELLENRTREKTLRDVGRFVVWFLVSLVTIVGGAVAIWMSLANHTKEGLKCVLPRIWH